MKEHETHEEGGKPEGTGGLEAFLRDCEERRFRSSDDARQGYIYGVKNFDVRPVTYSVIDDVAIFEGDIALGSPGEMEIIKQQVESEATPDVTARATAAAPGEIVHGVGINRPAVAMAERHRALYLRRSPSQSC